VEPAAYQNVITLGDISTLLSILAAVVFVARHFEHRLTALETKTDPMWTAFTAEREATANDEGRK
jgi:hypothetical protein